MVVVSIYLLKNWRDCHEEECQPRYREGKQVTTHVLSLVPTDHLIHVGRRKPADLGRVGMTDEG